MHFLNESHGYTVRNRSGIISPNLHRSNWAGVGISADYMICLSSMQLVKSEARL